MEILLVDDHGLFREGVAALLRSFDPAVGLAHAGSGRECLEKIARQPFDIVFLDLGLPDRPGMEVLRALKAGWPDTAVVVLSGDESRDTVVAAIQAGATGFVPKSADRPETLWHAIRLAAAGGVTVPASVHAGGTPAAAAPPPASRPVRQTAEGLGLTPRQFDVLRLLLLGLPNKSIARRLDIAESTARDHVSGLLAHFHVTNRTQLVLEIGRLGIVVGSLPGGGGAPPQG